MKQSVSTQEKCNSMCIAVFLFESLICQMISGVINIPNISVLLMIFLFGWVLLWNQRYNQLNIQTLFVTMLILIGVLILSGLFNGFQYVSKSLLYFIVFGVPTFFISNINYNYKLVLKYSIWIAILYSGVYLIFIRREFKASELYWSRQMGVAYGFLIPAVIALVILLDKYRCRFGKAEKILAAVVLLLAAYVICIDCGTRGAMLALAVSAFLLFIDRFRTWKKIFLILIAAVAGVVLISNLESTLLLMNRVLLGIGINVPAISKAVWMLQRNMVDNGRNELYVEAWKIFQSHVLTGRGVGYLEKVTGETYVHNILLELLSEVGLIGTIPIVYLMIRKFLVTFLLDGKKRTNESLNQILFLITIPLLTFSSSFWLLPSFWLYFWNLLKRERRNDNIYANTNIVITESR